MKDADQIVDALEEIRDVLLELRDRVAGLTTGTSSVELKTSTRGIDQAHKAYANSPIEAAEGEAIDSYFRTREAIKRRLMDDFEAEARAVAEAAR